MNANGSDERSSLRTTLSDLIRRKPRNMSETTPKTTQKTNPTQTGKEKKETKEKDNKKPSREEKEERAQEWGLFREGKPMPGLILSKQNLKCAVADGLAVVLSAEAFSQLYAYAKAMETKSEISCLGSVRREGNAFHIQRFYLVKQTGSFGGTELDQAAIAELVEQLMGEGKQEEARSLKCWCHTHGTMNAFWSQTDEATCRLLVSDYLISIVVGGGFQVRCRLDTQTPIPLTIDGIKVYYEPSIQKQDVDKYAEELKQHVVPDMATVHAYRQEDQKRKKKATEIEGDEDEDEDKDSLFEEDEVEVFCEYCGGWHEEGKCPVLDEETDMFGDWECGRFC